MAWHLLITGKAFCEDSSSKSKEYRSPLFQVTQRRQMMVSHMKMKLILKGVIILNWWTSAVLPKL
jgi:hypothetical protein